MHELAYLMQRVCPDRDLLLELTAVVEDDRAIHLDSRGEVVELDFLEHDATITLPPHACRQVRDHVVAIEDLDQNFAVRLQRTRDVLQRLLVGLVVEVTERREQRVRGVELILEVELAHVAANEVDREAAAMRFFTARTSNGVERSRPTTWKPRAASSIA